MTYIIDRRLNAKNKSTVNRQRFLKRYQSHIKKAVAEAITKRSITDIDKGEKISIPKRDISEPIFHHGPGGKRSTIHPGNKEFIAGDKLLRPKQNAGGGSGRGQASNSGDGMDEFVFQITQDEFLEFMFEDLELPYLVKKQLIKASSMQFVRSGVTSVGIPAKLNIIRSLRSAHARRIALGGVTRRKIKLLQHELDLLLLQPELVRDTQRIHELTQEITRLENRLKKIPFIDTFDLRYNNDVLQPKPSTSAVMFCLMDVSGSMTQTTKDMAKRFFILLYLFLKRNYERTDVVFIRHHTSAKEVNEEEFFYSRETGGTIVSSVLHEMSDIIKKRYSPSDWNIYAAQASDGDNWNDDSPVCRDLLVNDIMPKVQHYSYVEITPREHQALWYAYEQVKEQFSDQFSLQQITDVADIYPVFRKLFHRRAA